MSQSGSMSSDSPFLVLVAGEAATEPEFMCVLQEVVERIPGIRIHHGGQQTSDTGQQEPTELSPGVELIVSDTPAFAAAKGATFWMRMRLDNSHCDEWCAAHPGECMSQYDMRDEL